MNDSIVQQSKTAYHTKTQNIENVGRKPAVLLEQRVLSDNRKRWDAIVTAIGIHRQLPTAVLRRNPSTGYNELVFGIVDELFRQKSKAYEDGVAAGKRLANCRAA